VIAATNKDLHKESQTGNFREDLYYRLNVVPVTIPPLRKRISDLPVLVEHFLRVTAQELGQKPKKMSKKAMTELMEYNWPGNVRELENLIERLVILTPKPVIDVEDLPILGPAKNLEDQFLERDSYNDFREAVEKEFFLRKLRSHGYNVSKTARRLGMQRSNLYKKLEKYGIPYKKGHEDEEDE
jgi:two-component system, NtrC family, nitrogen regulation response regulator NtrX